MTRVLVVDDEPDFRRALALTLRSHGYTVVTAADGEEALRMAAEAPPDLVVLDLGLPVLDGVGVLTRLRAWSAVPVLVLSGRSDSADKVDALDAGADDYVTKPFGIDELLARLRVMARRAPAEEEPAVVELQAARIEPAARRVTLGAEEVRLTPTEWHLLDVFLRNPGRLLSQRELLAEVWGPGYESAQGNLRLYMAQLRRKLEADPSRPVHFVNEPGLGYRFQP
ncbi:response regulator [Nocardioides jiangxiensis]|uniref:Response regulator n=1 Tax=Nocardioides jiangxiensis TaxID=3064524 RepID=A0ABT9B604_9ACTN|nr:response regulator [Nocardioides sp. WY-20]MDO7869042.1 response regulator [Nocardioides sp. WY-20]